MEHSGGTGGTQSTGGVGGCGSGAGSGGCGEGGMIPLVLVVLGEVVVVVNLEEECLLTFFDTAMEVEEARETFLELVEVKDVVCP